jgi:hypothetical protein
MRTILFAAALWEQHHMRTRSSPAKPIRTARVEIGRKP